MHGIVYVPESEAPSDPLEAEGAFYIFHAGSGYRDMLRRWYLVQEEGSGDSHGSTGAWVLLSWRPIWSEWLDDGSGFEDSLC